MTASQPVATRRIFLQAGALAGLGAAMVGPFASLPGFQAWAQDGSSDEDVAVASFSDVSEDDWFYEAVQDAVSVGFMTGYRDEQGSLTGFFGPNDPMTREQLAVMLYKRYAPDEAAQMNAPEKYCQIRNGTPMSDVGSGQYYTPAVNFCYENGLLIGYDEHAGRLAGLFGVGRAVTRAEFAETIYRAYGSDKTDASLERFPDASDVQEWSVESMAWSAYEGIVTGVETPDGLYLEPNRAATRAEVAAMMSRYIRLAKTYYTGSTTLALGITETALGIESTVPFVQDISAQNIVLGGGLSDWTIASVDRVSDSLVCVGISGGTPLTEDGGSVLLDEGSFENPYVMAYLAVFGEEPEAEVPEALTGGGQGYVDGAFVIPVCIGSAQFKTEVSADAFRLPSDAGITAQSVSVISNNEVAVSLLVPGATAQEQFAVLDSALTEGGLIVGSSATNAAGDLVARAKAVVLGSYRAASGYDYEARALEYVKATPSASLEVTGATLNADGTVSVEARVVVSVVEGGGGAVDLSRASGICVYDPLSDGAVLADGGTIALVESSSFTFSHAFSAECAQLALSADGFDDSGSTVTQEHLDAALPHLACLFAGCRLRAAGGVLNAWGIDQDIDGISIAVAGDDAGLLSNEPEGESASELQYAEHVEAGLNATKEALTAVGELINGVMGIMEGKDWGSLFCGVGSIFGLAAELVGISEGNRYTIDEVMVELQTVHREIGVVSAQVGVVNDKLDKIERRQSYFSAVDEFTNLCQKVFGSGNLGVGPLVQSALESIDFKQKVDENTGMIAYDDLDDDTKKKLAVLVTQLRTYTGDKTHDLFVELAGYINSSPSRASICDSYFDYVASYYNWEPETYLPRKAFLTYAGTAFVYLYVADMVEANMRLHDAIVAGDAIDEDYQRRRLSAILAASSRVVETMVGKVKDGKVVQESSLVTRTRDYDSTHIVNLVVDASHNLFTASALLDEPVWNLNVDAALKNHSVNKMPSVSYDESSTITRANLRTMQSNLSSLVNKDAANKVVSFKSLADELRAMGTTTKTYKDASGKDQTVHVYGTVAFKLNYPEHGDKLGQEKRKRGYLYQYDKGLQILVSQTQKHNISDKSGGHHERSWTGTVANLEASSNIESEQTIVWARSGRGWSWHINVRLYNYHTFAKGTPSGR